MQRGETVIPKGMKASQGGPAATFTFAPVIDARGADSSAVARLEATVKKLHQDFEKRALRAVQGEKSLNPMFGRP